MQETDAREGGKKKTRYEHSLIGICRPKLALRATNIALELKRVCGIRWMVTWLSAISCGFQCPKAI